MSSARYVAELQPDPLMRRVVLLTTLLACAAGVAVLSTLPIDPYLRSGSIAAWSIWLAWNLAQRHVKERQLLRIRLFGDASAALLRPDGSWTRVEVAPDSTVLAGLAWLALCPEAGPAHTELLRGNSRECEDWRRLQVIWRHLDRGRDSALGSGS